MKKLARKLLNDLGYDLKRHPEYDLRRKLKLLKTFQINTVFDVGANVGQYGSLLRNIKFEGRIVSFEPLSSAYQKLVAASRQDKNWETENIAIGDSDGEIEINISENSASSSILDMLPNHVKEAPKSRYINKEKVKLYKLDSIYPKYIKDGEKVFLKIDTQGYEKNVLDGAEDFLKHVTGLQIEMSIVPLYSNEFLIDDMISFLQSRGFGLYSLENGFSSKETGQLFQVDGIFFRK
jgi:FkbM family methyltransferase